MKTFNIRQIAFVILGALFISFSAASCSKDSDAPGIPGHGNYGTHYVDAQLAGDWMWTSGSASGYYDANGTWLGGQYGFATRMSIDANGNGTLFNHVYSDLGYGSYLAVDIYYTGYYEMDDAGNLTFYPMGGTYKSSSGTNRSLRSDELYNPSNSSGTTFTYPSINFTTQDGRECLTTTYSDVETDVFFKQ